MGKRRDNNEGSITQRNDGRWQASLIVGYNDEGKPKRHYVYGKSSKEVKAKLKELLKRQAEGTFVEPHKTTLGEWLGRWLEQYMKAKLKRGTFESYNTLVTAHIKPAVGNIQLIKLQANMLQKFYNDMLSSGRKKPTKDGEKGLSTRYVRYMHTVIREALQQAVKENLLARNPADATEPPTVKTKEMRPLSEQEMEKFLESASDDRLFPAYVLAVATGLRRGELLGLCWDCVDLNAGTVTVRRQLLSLKGGPVLEETTKTKSGRRCVTIPDNVVKMLRSHKTQQDRQKNWFAGGAYEDNNLVFCKEDGTMLDPAEFTKRFQKRLYEAGLPRVRLHDLRHTHASLLLARGVHPKIVQERLGHSTITMTLDLYSHLAPGLQEAAAAEINGLFASKEKAPESEAK
jgi:integrase